MLKWLRDTKINNKYLITCSLLFFSIVISARVVLENAYLSTQQVLTYYIYFHHYCWFSFVFIWIVSALRHVAKLPLNKVPFLSIFSIATLIPVIASLLTGRPLDLAYNYLNRVTVIDFMKIVVTMNYSHLDNNQQFYELLSLNLITFFGSLLISKSLLRAFFTTVLAYFGGFFIAGIHWFGFTTRSRTEAVFLVPSSFTNQQASTFIYYFLLVVLFVILLLPDIKKLLGGFFSEKSIGFSIMLFIFWMLMFVFIYNSPTTREVSMFDIIITYIPAFLVMQFLLLYKTLTSIERILFGWLACVGVFIVSPLFL